MTLQHFQVNAAQASPRNLDAIPLALFDLFWQLPDAQRHHRFASTETAAARYEISRRTIQRWVKEGHIDAVPIGKKYHVDLLSLKAHLQALAAQRDAD